MRITDNLRINSMQRSLARVSSDHAEAIQQAASGLRLNKASDDPLGAAYAARVQNSLKQSETYRTNIGLVRSDMQLAEGALAESIEVLNQVRESAMQGANDSMDPENRKMLASKVATLKEQLLSLSNSKGTSGYLFSGHRIDTPAFASDGTYQGDDGQRRVEAGPGTVVDANVNGGTIFNDPDGVNVFAALDTLEAALLADDGAQISQSLTGIDQALSQVTQGRSQTGLIMNRLDMSEGTLEQTELELTKRRAAITDADPFETLSRMTQLGTTLQQAIAVARTTLNQSLNRF
jgi:flagellar hook-associated protein 3 FlgL